jgi:modification methylase
MKSPKYVNEILLGDTLEVLKTLPPDIIDMGVTSPPYNKGENKKGWLVQNVKYVNSTDKVPERIYQDNQVSVLNELFRITRPGGSFFYNHKVRWEKGLLLHPMDWLRNTHWTIKQEIIWDRIIAANIRGWRFWQVEERIYWLYKPIDNHYIGKELKPKHALLTSIWRFPPEKANSHPAPFPIALPARAIYSFMDENKGLIIDPYCGSGTTLVAAKLLGHDFIGIDISEEYINHTKFRVQNSDIEKLPLLEEVEKHKVSKTFSDRKKNGGYTGKFKQTNKNSTTEQMPLELLNQK